MQGAQWGKLVKVQHCPATVTPLVKSDNPPFMTQNTSWKGSLGTGEFFTSRPHPVAQPGRYDLTTFSRKGRFSLLKDLRYDKIAS